MSELVKLYDNCYMTKGKTDTYMLKKGNIGIYASGECYRLEAGNKVIACFVTRSDYHNCENEYSVDSRLWTIDELVTKANEIIKIVESINADS